jgi:multimeric flavodoxin WrbA
MDIPLFVDGDTKTALSEYTREQISQTVRAAGRGVKTIELFRDDLPPCTGCLRCITKHPGRCVHQEAFAEITRQCRGAEVILYLTHPVFGTFPSALKNVIDRGGLIITNHNSCRQFIVGCGNDATDEERDTFIDITARHRGKADIVHPGLSECFEAHFTRSENDTRRICEHLGGIL